MECGREERGAIVSTPDEQRGDVDELGRTQQQARQWVLRRRFSVFVSLLSLLAGRFLPLGLSLALLCVAVIILLVTLSRLAPGRCGVCQRWTSGAIIDTMPEIRWWLLWPPPRAKQYGCPQHWSHLVYAKIRADSHGPMDDRT